MTSGPTQVSKAVAARLKARALDTELPAILVLPSQVRGGTDYYSELDLEAVKIALDAGLDADYLDGAEDRAFLGEYSADLWIGFAIGVAGNLTSEGLVMIGNYVRAQLRSLRGRNLIGAPETERVRLVVQKIEIVSTSAQVTITGVEVEAVGLSAVPQLLAQLGSGDELAQALLQLEGQNQPEDQELP